MKDKAEGLSLNSSIPIFKAFAHSRGRRLTRIAFWKKWEEKAKRDFLRILTDKKGKIKKWEELFPPLVELEFRFSQWYAKCIAEQFVIKFPGSIWEAVSPPEDVYNTILQEFGHVGPLRRKPPWRLEGPV